MMKAILRTFVLALIVAMAPAQPTLAQAVSAATAVPGFTCDSETGKCNCKGYFDCKKMEDKVCDSNEPFICTLGTADCNCIWDLAVSPGGDGKFHFKGAPVRVFETEIVK